MIKDFIKKCINVVKLNMCLDSLNTVINKIEVLMFSDHGVFGISLN